MEILDVKKLAEYLGTSEWLVRQRTNTSEIPSFRVGGRLLYRKEAIDEWIKAQETAGGNNE